MMTTTGMETFIYYFFILLSCFGFNVVSGLMCYECDNKEIRGCGTYFKAYQFKPVNCGNSSVKCAIQRQPPNEKDWIGILRGCYRLGQLPGINETNGCRYWENSEGFTALYCFCDTDYCNSSPKSSVLSTFSPVYILLQSFAIIGALLS